MKNRDGYQTKWQLKTTLTVDQENGVIGRYARLALPADFYSRVAKKAGTTEESDVTAMVENDRRIGKMCRETMPAEEFARLYRNARSWIEMDRRRRQGEAAYHRLNQNLQRRKE